MSDSLTLNEEIIRIVGLCPQCGGDPNISYNEVTKQKIVDTQLSLEENDPKLAATFIRYNVLCPPCDGAAKFQSKADMFKQRVDRLRRETYQKHLIPEKGKSETFEKSKPDYEMDNADIWDRFKKISKLKSNFWWWGEPGKSKTYIARAILNRQIDLNISVAEITALEIQEIGASFHPSRDLKKYESIGVLLIEDIDKGDWTKKGLAALWSLIDIRSKNDMRIIITSNPKPGRVSAQLRIVGGNNDSIASSMFGRLLPMEDFEMVGRNLRVLENQDTEQPHPEVKTEPKPPTIPQDDDSEELF